MGDGPLAGAVDAGAARLGLGGAVVRAGAVPHERVADWMAACDVLALPSRVEPLGIVALEALASGRPVAATMVGGAVEVVPDGPAGAIVDPADPGDIARGLLRLIDRPPSAADCRRGGRGPGRRWAGRPGGRGSGGGGRTRLSARAMYPRSPMSTLAPTRPAALAALVFGVVAAGALAVWQPLFGVGLAVLALAVALIRAVPMPRVAQVAVLVTAVAAIAGPNLAVPGAGFLFAFRILIVILGLGARGLPADGRPARAARPPCPARPGCSASGSLWSALSIGWATDAASAVRWTLFLAMMSGLAIALALACRTRRRVVILLIVLGATFAVAFLIAMAEIVLGIRLPTSALLGQSQNTAFAATSLFGNQNNFATYLTLTLPYFLTLPVIFRDVRVKAVGFAGGACALIGLLYTGSKANLIATGLILIGPAGRARPRPAGARAPGGGPVGGRAGRAAGRALGAGQRDHPAPPARRDQVRLLDPVGPDRRPDRVGRRAQLPARRGPGPGLADRRARGGRGQRRGRGCARSSSPRPWPTCTTGGSRCWSTTGWWASPCTWASS